MILLFQVMEMFLVVLILVSVLVHYNAVMILYASIQAANKLTLC